MISTGLGARAAMVTPARAAAAMVAVGLSATGLAAQSPDARAAFEAYLACEKGSAAATTPEAFVACYAPESHMAQLSAEVVNDLMRTAPLTLSEPVLIGHVEADTGMELRIRGLLEGAPAAESVVMRRIEGDWLIVEVRTRVYADALTGALVAPPLGFALSIDGERVLDESSGIIVVADVGFPSLVVMPLFEEGPTLQIDNLRVGARPQRFTRQPADAILADPDLVSAEVRGEGIPPNGRIEGELSIKEPRNAVVSGEIRFSVSDFAMDSPIDVAFTFENLPLPD